MKSASVLLVVCCSASLSAASVARASFGPQDVVRQVHSGHSTQRLLDPSSPDLDGGEFLLDTVPMYWSAPNVQENPAVAFDGANFLVVWQDTRSAYYPDIWGARVTPQGTVLDPAGIVISHEANDQVYPAVGFDGANFLVVWGDGRGSDIYGARVTPQGTVLDTAGIAITQAADHQYSPAVGFDGTNFLVVWQDYRDGNDWDIYGARVTPAGVVLDPSGTPISTALRYQERPDVCFDGTNYLVVWIDTRSGTNADIYGARVTPEGLVLDTAGIPICSYPHLQHDPSVAFNGTVYFVVWDDSRNGTDDIYGTRVTTEGAVLDPEGIPVQQATLHQYSPDVACDGTNFLAVWFDNNWSEVYGARVTPDGEVLDSSGFRVAHSIVGGLPAVAFGDEYYLVLWTRNSDVQGARVTPAGTVLDPTGLTFSTAANPQTACAVATDAVNFLTVWEDERAPSDPDIYAARVNPEGTVLDSLSAAVSTAENRQGSPAVVGGGSGYLAVWEDLRAGHDIYGARLSSSGAVLDSQGFVVSAGYSSQEFPAIASDGAGYLVVWQDARNGEADIYGARLSSSGALLDSQGIAISTANGPEALPAVAFVGTSYFVVWQDSRSGMYTDVFGARVTPQGTVLDPAGLVVSQAAGDQSAPALGFDGANSFVVWQDARDYVTTGYDIYGTRVTPQGIVLDTSGLVISQAANAQESPALAFDGTNFLVVWQDMRSDSLGDIYGARVTRGGTVFDAGSVVSQQRGQTCPKLCLGSGSQLFLVYQGWAGSVGGKAYSTDRIWGKMDPNPAVAEIAKPDVRRANGGATIIRRVLSLQVDSRQQSAYRVELLNATGRKVMDLGPGANDVRALAPGVYFVRGPETEDGRPFAAVRKVVVAK